MSGTSVPASYFEGVYGADADPWRYETSAYEHAKYDRTVAALPRALYADALEIGCSIGVLTERLAPHCQRLLAVDVNETALARARQRCAALPQVRTARLQLPGEAPDGRWDLILLSEVGYYWSQAELERATGWIFDRLLPGGTFELVHWTHPVHDYPLGGNTVHNSVAAIARERGAAHLLAERHPDYRLDVYAASSG